MLLMEEFAPEQKAREAVGQEQTWRDLPRQRTERLFEAVAPHNRSEERAPGHLSKDGGNMC